MSRVKRILETLSEGDERAADHLVRVVYDDLRQLAARKLANEPAGQTLGATALVHEAYLRLVGRETSWANRSHFFGAAAEAMRRILIERARRRSRAKHGGGRKRFEVKESDLVAEPDPLELLALDDALDKLEQQDRAKADLVKLRYFAGLTLADSARIQGVSVATAERHWAYARAWLLAEISRDSGPLRPS